jgi:hypothetical protein
LPDGDAAPAGAVVLKVFNDALGLFDGAEGDEGFFKTTSFRISKPAAESWSAKRRAGALMSRPVAKTKERQGKGVSL